MIYVCGDTHLKMDIKKLYKNTWPIGQTLTKDDYLIILGDTGIVWFVGKNQTEKQLLDWYNKQPWTTLFIDGNHDNHNRLILSDEFKEIDMFDSKVKKISDSIFYLQRGHVYNIENYKIFTFGGGESVDKNVRLIDIDWWELELPTCEQCSEAIYTLEKIDNKVDFILTHTCSHQTFDNLFKYYDFGYKKNCERSLRSLFSYIEEHVKFKHWHFGHFHDDIQVDSKHTLHYENQPVRLIEERT